jgi:hypothetical protein
MVCTAVLTVVASATTSGIERPSRYQKEGDVGRLPDFLSPLTSGDLAHVVPVALSARRFPRGAHAMHLAHVVPVALSARRFPRGAHAMHLAHVVAFPVSKAALAHSQGTSWQGNPILPVLAAVSSCIAVLAPVKRQRVLTVAGSSAFGPVRNVVARSSLAHGSARARVLSAMAPTLVACYGKSPPRSVRKAPRSNAKPFSTQDRGMPRPETPKQEGGP